MAGARARMLLICKHDVRNLPNRAALWITLWIAKMWRVLVFPVNRVREFTQAPTARPDAIAPSSLRVATHRAHKNAAWRAVLRCTRYGMIDDRDEQR